MHPLEPGDPHNIGSYTLLARLGSGGMGVVFLARSRGGRAVAVKVIRPDLADQSGFRARFAREIASARRVGGVFTCAVLDADADAPRPWLATEYIAGPSLQQAVDAHGPLPPDALHRLAAGLAEALSSIHAAGVVHRDLKPSNVLLAGDGPRVIDFGIARLVNESTLTATKGIVGSAGYLAPELVVGTEAGPASDVFSLGAVLAFAATGRGPFGTGPAPVMLHRVVHEPADLAAVPPGALREVMSACLDKDPRRRPLPRDVLGGPVPEPVTWPSGPLNGDIQARQTQLTTLLARQRPATGRRRFLTIALAGMGVAVAGGGGATVWAGWQENAPVERKWQLRAATMHTYPQLRIDDTLLYLDDETLHAVDTESGRQLWNHPAGRGSNTPPIVAAPSSVLLCDVSGVDAVDLATGSARHVFEPLKFDPPNDVLGLRNGVILLLEDSSGSSESLIARTLADGAAQWSLPVELRPGATFALSGDRLFFVDARYQLLAVNVTDGSVIWRHQANDTAGPVLADGDATYLKYKSGIQAFDAATGRARWNYSNRGEISGLTLSQGSLYGIGGTAFSIDAATGRPRWTSSTRAGARPSAPVICSGIMFAGISRSFGPQPDAVDGGVFGWDAATGELVWRYPHSQGATPDDDRDWRLVTGRDMVFAANAADLLAFKVG